VIRGMIVMRLASAVFLAFGLLFQASLGTASAADGRFDGRWGTTLTCRATNDAAKPYIFRFFTDVKDSMVHGEHGIAGQPDWLVIDGTIDSNGDSALIADGLMGNPDHTLGHVEVGSPYKYRIKAHFGGAHGTGERIGARVCILDLVKV
jgi:hypothetical protein